MQKGAFWVQDDEERKCEGGGFDWEVAISSHNENMTIQALLDTLTALQSGYETSIAEDTRILANSDDGIGKELSPTRRASVSLRKREKELIESVIDFLDTRRRNLDNITYQIDIVRKKEEDRKRRIAERKAWRERIFEELEKKPLVEIPVDLGAGKKATYTVMEGDDIEKTAMAFGIENQLTYAGLDQIKAIAKQRIAAIPQHPIEFFMPVILADGVRVAIRVNRGRKRDSGSGQVLRKAWCSRG